MRQYTAEKYENLVENTENPMLRRFMAEESAFLAQIPDSQSRTFIDLGAGHGRVIPKLADISKNVIAIEINPEMFRGLSDLASKFDNVVAVQGDILHLDQILAAHEIVRPEFLILQNSLGTIEGDYQKVLKVVADEARNKSGELVLSLFRATALEDQGLEMYAGLSEMVGEVDSQKTDVSRGLFVSKTGYSSKWWTDEEIEGFKSLGKIEDELVEPEFTLLRISF